MKWLCIPAIGGLRVLKPDPDTVPIAVVILVTLFAFQQFDTAIIGKLFGPAMVAFFLMLAVLGLKELVQPPIILKALNPYYALHMLATVPGAFWLLTAAILVVMVGRTEGQRIRNDLVESSPLADWLPTLRELSLDESVPKYATHLVCLTKSADSKLIENGIIHSIFKKRPKRAEVYYLVHVHTTDEPYTRRYHVEHLVPRDLIRIDFYFGFRVDQAVNYPFRQVVNDLMKTGFR